MLFSASPDFSFAGIRRLRAVYLRDYGRELTERQLMRELRQRDAFRHSERMQTPLLLLTHDADPAYADQRRFVDLLRAKTARKPICRASAACSPASSPPPTTACAPPGWPETRDRARAVLFDFIAARLPGGAEESDAQPAAGDP